MSVVAIVAAHGWNSALFMMMILKAQMSWHASIDDLNALCA